MPTRAVLLMLAVALAGLAGCRSGAPVTWGATPAPTVRADVVDARGRFREIFCTLREVRGVTLPDDRPCADALVKFAGEPPGTGATVVTAPSPSQRRIVVVQGIFGECIGSWITPFGDARPKLTEQGYRPELLRVSGTAGSGQNAQRVRDFVLGLDMTPEEKVVLVGYSKGAVDILEALVAFPDLVPRVSAVVSVAGPITGSPLADGVAPWRRSLIEAIASPICGGGRGGITSLTREERRTFMKRVQLPTTVRYFSVIGIVEEPEVSRALLSFYRDLARVDPHNDGQVLQEDGVIPGAVLLGYVRADHWAIALPFSRARGTLGWLARLVVDRNAFPREVLLEAIVRAVEDMP